MGCGALWEPVAADVGREAGSALKRSPVYCRASCYPSYHIIEKYIMQKYVVFSVMLCSTWC